MGDADLLLFFAASVVVILAPGPDNILVLTRGVTLGLKAALISASDWLCPSAGSEASER